MEFLIKYTIYLFKIKKKMKTHFIEVYSSTTCTNTTRPLPVNMLDDSLEYTAQLYFLYTVAIWHITLKTKI